MNDRWGEDRERRGEFRFATAGRICWKRRDKNITFVGWLSDASSSSISFVTSAISQPSYGEELELIRADRSTRRCRVMRMAPYDDHFTLIGCRFIKDDLDNGGDQSPEDTSTTGRAWRRRAADVAWDLDGFRM